MKSKTDKKNPKTTGPIRLESDGETILTSEEVDGEEFDVNSLVSDDPEDEEFDTRSGPSDDEDAVKTQDQFSKVIIAFKEAAGVFEIVGSVITFKIWANEEKKCTFTKIRFWTSTDHAFTLASAIGGELDSIKLKTLLKTVTVHGGQNVKGYFTGPKEFKIEEIKKSLSKVSIIFQTQTMF